MNAQELIDDFLARTDLSPAEVVIKNKIIALRETFLGSQQTMQDMKNDLAVKEKEFLTIKSNLETVLALIIDLNAVKAQV